MKEVEKKLVNSFFFLVFPMGKTSTVYLEPKTWPALRRGSPQSNFSQDLRADNNWTLATAKPQVRNYRKLTEACHTKAKRKNKIGITGKTSTKGLKGAYASGNLAKKISVICIFEFANKYYIIYYKLF